tara:strand:- start:144667 stop:145140 length:474 start_codon:yes stop_codon:yes gene_type:complete
MFEIHRVAVATITLVVLCAASLWASVIAQDIFDSSVVTEPAQPADAKVVETIRKALHDDSAVPSSDDPILDDVLNVIRQQGSVLDGSPLDPKLEPLPESASDADRGDRSLAPASHRALAAERLLKAARLLEQVQPLDNARRQLVKQMRRETVRLLSE